ncbi:MAG: PAS domain S-box protein, partial [Candidatus Hydrothermarchaeales archaeon]
KVPPYEIEVFDKNGDEVRLEVNVTPIRVGGRISELGVARDITERKKKEQEIKYLKESYEEIIKSSPVAIYTIDNDFTIRSWNPAMERLTGIKAERAINSSWYKFFSFLKEYGFDEKIDKVMRTKKPIELERLAIEFPRSARGFLKVKIAPLIKGGALIILEDVTERAKLERELAESEEKYKGLVENAGAGVYKHDREGRFIFANKKLADIYGHATEELLGHSFVEFISREDVEVYKKNIERTIKRLEPVGTFECKIVRKDGEIGTVEVTPTPLIERGRLVGFQGVITDITERKKLEQKIIEAKNEAEFLNDLMSHDINNANAVAIGTLRLLGDTLELDKKQERFLNRSLSAVHRSARLIDNVRKLQQAKAMGEESFMIRDLSPTLEDAIHDATALHKDKEVRINYTPKETLIYTDDLVKDLFLNLVDNAIKYDRSNKVIVDVSVEDLGENWKIGIEDRGRGVPDKMKEAIFNRYQRLHEGIRGSGIGLHLVRVLVERYNGKAWVEDRAEGDQSKGSIFYVVLPKGGR